MQLKNKVAIITGAGQGIGRAIALHFAHAGAKIVVGDLNIETANQTVREIESNSGQAIALQVNVTRQTDVFELIAKASQVFGRLDILVNNVGVCPNTSIVDIPEAEWDMVLAVNLKGTFLCSQAAARQMIKQKNGVIINITSVDAKTRTTANAHYAAAKAGVISFTRTLACETAPYGIRVNAVAPGWIASNPAKAMTDRWRRAVEEIPVHRLGTPDDVAEAVLFLASDAAGYITGEVLDVNGGIVMD